MYRMPNWLADSFFVEMCAETRKPEGWDKPGKTRNEAWDLSYYAIGLCVSPMIRAESIDWASPPGWAAEWDENSLVSKVGEKERFAYGRAPSYDVAAAAKILA
jgi:phage terminase large subunit GpA-like protein